MSLFESIMMSLSIVVGLGLAKILSGFSQALIARQVGRDGWLPVPLESLAGTTRIS